MLFRFVVLGATVALCGASAAAQQRGTVEFGVFGSAGRFDRSLTLDRGVGGGGRGGGLLDPRWALEFEKAEMRASRTLGLTNVNVGILSGRLVATPIQAGPLSLMLGAGAGASTETNFLHSYGVNGLVGLKIALGSSVALRADGIAHWLANNDWQRYQTVHLGLSFFRNPHNRVVNITRTVEVPGPVIAQRPDSVDWQEQARLRRADNDYRMLRDSLSRVPAPVTRPASSAAELSTMETRIQFGTNQSALTDSAHRILDAKLPVFRANTAIRIVIVGHTDERASDAYNMALGDRRSASAKAYLVAQGIDPARIEIASRGEHDPRAAGTSVSAQGMNRRAEFRVLVVSDTSPPPQKQ
jgi:outer membrane protein OmpA-like peptidoglycan-associated protein